MRALWNVIYRTIFWSYERGTWPYDIAVAAIVVFVLLTPRTWFHDQPQVGPPPTQQAVVFLADDPATATKKYSVDAALLAPPIRTPELEHDLHDAMRKNVREFKGRSFEIKHIEAVRDDKGRVVSYDVWVKP